MTATTLATLQKLLADAKDPVAHAPNTGCLAFNARQSYAQTQRDLAALEAEGLVVKLPIEKGEQAARYVTAEVAETHAVPQAESCPTNDTSNAAGAYLGRVLPGLK